ncbi:hypothetical protein BHE74_00002295, partial [Ensete ventricosum]
VQNLIERCLQLYMNKGEVVRTLSNRARIDPGFTALESLLTLINLIQCQPLLSAVNNLPMGYPVLQPQIPTPGQLHVDPMACVLSSYHVVNGIPAPGSSHPIRMNTGNE